METTEALSPQKTTLGKDFAQSNFIRVAEVLISNCLKK